MKRRELLRMVEKWGLIMFLVGIVMWLDINHTPQSATFIMALGGFIYLLINNDQEQT
jgi:hypothetical protein